MQNNRYELNKQLAQMLKGGVIMDVTTPEQAKIAEAAGACAVMALERIPADIRAAGGVSRMSDPKMIKGIQQAVSIPVMAKCRSGHFAEAQILQAIEIDYIDESEVLSGRRCLSHRQNKVSGSVCLWGKGFGRSPSSNQRGSLDDSHKRGARDRRYCPGCAPYAQNECRNCQIDSYAYG